MKIRKANGIWTGWVVTDDDTDTYLYYDGVVRNWYERPLHQEVIFHSRQAARDAKFCYDNKIKTGTGSLMKYWGWVPNRGYIHPDGSFESLVSSKKGTFTSVDHVLGTLRQVLK